MYGEPRPVPIAHRGGMALAPENTITAFRQAVARGFDHVETDVRLTADGQLVCFHDATLDRATDGRGRINRRTLAELGTLRVNGGGRIPTLADALGELPDTNFTIDVKEAAAVEPLARLIHTGGHADRVCVAGAWDAWLDRVRALAPGVRTALGWRSLAALISTSRLGLGSPRQVVGMPFAHVPLRIGRTPLFGPRVLDGAHRLGVRVMVWTVNDAPTMHALLALGVDGIITDRPDVLRAVMTARGLWRERAGHTHQPQELAGGRADDVALSP